MSVAEDSAFPVVHCVVAVHNRLAVTRAFVAQMLEQDYPAWNVVIVDDGSTDGTSEWLAQLEDKRFRILRGSGALWWGGAMNLGMQAVFQVAADSHYLLMLNDDVRIRPEYITQLVRTSRARGSAVVGSAQRFFDGRSFPAAYRIDYLTLRLSLVEAESAEERVDALTGRGLLIPVRAARCAGFIHRGLPHHLGDLEYTARLREQGSELIVCQEAVIFTDDVPQDQAKRRRGILHRWFGSRSPDNFWQRLVFFHSRGPRSLRLIAAPRYLLVGVLRRFGVVS